MTGMSESDTDEEKDKEGSSTLTPGDPVLDTEDSDPSNGIVILRPDATIAEWTIDIDGEEVTIAETNPEYDPDDPVTIVAFERILDEYWPEWREASPNELFDGVCANSVKFYSFPISRLKCDPMRVPLVQRGAETEDESTDSTAGSASNEEEINRQEESIGDEEETVDEDDPPEADQEDEWEPPDWLETLREEIAGTTTAFDDEHEALRIEKLGETYYIDSDGSIEGDGALRSQLESRVDDIQKK
jgi:hypothetical protein